MDGKLGETTLWDSPLTNGSGTSYTGANYHNGGKGTAFDYMDGFKETLLGITEEGTYSDAGGYPAVFKTTAQAALLVGDANPDDEAVGETSNITVVSMAENPPDLSISQLTNNNNGTFTVTLGSNTLTDDNYRNSLLFGYSKQTGANDVTWSRSTTFTLPGEGTYYFYSYIAGHIDPANPNKLYTSSSIRTVGPITIVNYQRGNLLNNGYGTGVSTGTPYIMGSKRNDGSQFKYLYASNGSLQTNTISEGYNIFTNDVYLPGSRVSGATVVATPTPDWTLTKNYSTYQFNFGNTDKGLYFNNYYSYGTPSSLNLTERISANLARNYLDLDRHNFIAYTLITANDENKFFFHPISVNRGGTPTTLTSISGLTIWVDPDATIADVREALKNKGFTYADAANLHFAYISATNSYKLYATWTVSGLPYYTFLGNLTFNAGTVDTDSLSGFVMAGQSLYFMGEGASIDTNGETVNLLCDLLVIRDDIDTDEGGEIRVRPHSGAGEGDTIVFFVNGTSDGLFKDHNFYKVKAKTDLANVTSADFGTNIFHVCNTYNCDGIDCDGSVTRDASGNIQQFAAAVVDLSIVGYPVVNLDVAYASDEQLGHIVSGEAARWTTDGNLTVNSSTDNALYVICAFVDAIDRDIKGSANRIMIAAKDNFLSVDHNIELNARYISFDAGTIYQAVSGKSLIVRNLLEQNHTLLQSIIQFIQTLVGTNADFNSDTLQVEYEQATEVRNFGEEIGEGELVDAQIFRYKTGTDLFTAYLTDEEEDGENAAKQQLRVSYDTKDFNTAFNSAYHIHTVERYMDIVESEPLEMPIERFLFSVPVERHLNLYSNFISFDSSISEIKLGEYVSEIIGIEINTYQSDIIINTQESGYTEKEYLGFFKTNSADTYNGTILQVKGSLTVSRGSSSYTLSNGFYFVKATTNGTSLFDVAKNASTYYVADEDMLLYAQSLSNNHAYVDTGLETDDITGGGFGGGSVN